MSKCLRNVRSKTLSGQIYYGCLLYFGLGYKKSDTNEMKIRETAQTVEMQIAWTSK